MLKITLVILLSYAMVFTIIDPTAGGDPLPRNILDRHYSEAGESLVPDEISNARYINDGSNYHNNSKCDLTKGCDPERCCERGQKCGYNDGYFHCYHPLHIQRNKKNIE